MRTTLADNLNLTGTARYNLGVRHKRRLTSLTPENPERKNVPAAYESIVSFFNHSELAYINNIAIQAGATKIPFANVEPLPQDNGERFFSEYLTWMKQTKPKNDILCRCLCNQCRVSNKDEDKDEDEINLLAHCYPTNNDNKTNNNSNVKQ